MFEPQKAEDYFSTMNSPSRRLMQDIHDVRKNGINAPETQDWDTLSDQMKDKILDERLIDNLNGCSKPRPQKYHTLDRHSRRRSRDNKLQSTLANGKATVRLSTFGVEQVFPRLKIETGQKEVTVEETSNGFQTDDSSENQTYTYRDEHSAPFNWTTKSQQELRFEAGTPDYIPTESEASEKGLEKLRTISPKSATLNIRQSRGNPCYAKPVQIPQVPNMSAKSPTGGQSTLGRKSTKPSVSPHRINNFVCETSPNRLVLDFGNNRKSIENGSENGSDLSGPSTGHNSSTECSSSRSSVSLLEKMKQKTRTSIKRSISSVSNKSKNKRENSSKNNDRKVELSKCNPNSKEYINYKYSPTNSSLTLSTISIKNNSMTSLQSNHTLTSSAHQYSTKSNTKISVSNSRQSSISSFDRTDSSSSNNSQNKEPIYGTCRRNITKPSHAPPPPPANGTKPNFTPPPAPGSNYKSFIDSVPFITPILDDKESEDLEILKIQSFQSSSVLTKANKVVIKDSNPECNELIIPVQEETTKELKENDTNTKEAVVQNIIKDERINIIEPIKPLEEFKIDLNVDVEIPKTGFDFLDDW